MLDLGAAEDGNPFLVMEFLQGETLGSRLAKGGAMGVWQACLVLAEALDALAAAHQAGIVHRDLKPDNVFLAERPQRRVKLVDFGISKFRGADSLAVTQTGVVMGTPLYMSPEQARGSRDVGPATDLYSAGAILYEALAGRPPLSGLSYNEVIAKVLTEVPAPLRTVRPDLPEALGALVDALLSKDSAARPPDAAGVAALLRGFAAQAEADRGGPAPDIAPAAGARPLTARPGDRTGAADATERRSGSASAAPPVGLEPTLQRRPEIGPEAKPGVRTVSAEFEATLRPGERDAPWVAGRRRTGLVVGAVAGVAVVVGIGAAVFRPATPPIPVLPVPGPARPERLAAPPGPPEPAPARASPAPATPAPAPAPAFPVVLQARPASARWRMDGRELDCAGASCSLTAAPGERHVFEASAEGYRPQRQQVTVAGPVALQMSLERFAPVAPPTPPSAPPPSTAQPAAAPDAGRRSELDLDNPYRRP